MCNRGKSPAQETAKSVMASAKRLIEVRHCCRRSSRIAEISVPAWPIPIHHTKLTIANPQATGIVMPQMPTPATNKYVTATFRRMNNRKEMPKPYSHQLGVRPDRTIELILSETLPNV